MGHRKRGRVGPLGVCSNGAAVVDTSSMEVIEVQTMQAEVTGRLVTVVREVFPGVLFAVEEMETFTYETGFLDPSWNWDEGSAQVDDIVKAVSSGCVKLIRAPARLAGRGSPGRAARPVSRDGPRHLLGAGLGGDGSPWHNQSPCRPARVRPTGRRRS